MYKIVSLLLIIVTWGPPTLRGRSGNDSLQGIIDLPIVIQLLFWGMLGICALMIFIKRSRDNHKISLSAIFIPPSLFKGSLILWFLYSILALVSNLYSVSFMLTLVRSAQLFILIYIIAYMTDYEMGHPGVPQPMTIFIRGLELKFVFALSYILVDPSIVIKGNRLVGGEAGDLTITSAILSVYYLNELLNANKPSNKLRYILCFGASIAVLFLTKTRVSIISSLFCLCILLVIYLKSRWISITIILLGLSILVITGYMEDIVFAIMREYQSIRTLSGRTIIWKFCIQQSKGLIFHGYGYASGARYFLLNVFKDIELARNPGDAHNAFFESLLNLGWVASIILAASTVIAFIEAIKLFFSTGSNKKEVVLISMCLILVSLHNITTVGIAGHVNTIPILYTIILAGLQKLKKYNKNEKMLKAGEEQL